MIPREPLTGQRIVHGSEGVVAVRWLYLPSVHTVTLTTPSRRPDVVTARRDPEAQDKNGSAVSDPQAAHRPSSLLVAVDPH
jgi:hypothetical protein